MGLTRAFYQLENMKKPCSLWVGVILDGKQFLTTNLVSIDVQSLALNEKPTSVPYKIYYSTGGSQPNTNSKLYNNAFPVEFGTTVKAIVVQNDKVVLNMEETFDKNLGLCWEKNESETVQIINGMRAVDAEFQRATVQSNNNKQYLDFMGREGSVTWYQENDGSTGEFTLRIHYASNDKNSKRPMDLIINDKKVATLLFESTNSWNSNWKEVEIKQYLEAGANYIELRTTGQSAPNILMLVVEEILV